ncbi:insulinoma-associated protein 1a-like [Microcaecilia unicolor]|uniref:Insulinoma-associated protein 1a-like n=1 Tax=Microcaecilia unicolor TaxID=1415580 RepID=A0A6P7ZPI8_9AMPH|nr:insulinoma-associated protein 1a-like [Microcaecilia unicolor]
MPRGFLVKRTKKAGPVSYRIRRDEELQPPAGFASVITSTWMQVKTTPTLPVATRSPQRPVSSFQHQSSLDRALNCSSPAGAESFPCPTSCPQLFSDAQMQAKLGSLCGQSKAKKAKSSSRDEVTTSPVLGLRIKDDPQDFQPRRQSASPLGEFICQLCREQYADPLSLAQHKCSRIVRVEYRCMECPKAFSCPANLASHRRWHKPRSPQEPQAKENQSPSLALAPCPAPSEDTYHCSHCTKTFRRQAYLRKHLALHRPAVVLAESNSRGPSPAVQVGASSKEGHRTAPYPVQEGPFPRYLRPASSSTSPAQLDII